MVKVDLLSTGLQNWNGSTCCVTSALHILNVLEVGDVYANKTNVEKLSLLPGTTSIVSLIGRMLKSMRIVNFSGVGVRTEVFCQSIWMCATLQGQDSQVSLCIPPEYSYED